MKDATNGDTLRRVVSKRRLADLRMGEPNIFRCYVAIICTWERSKLKYLSSFRKRKQFSDFVSSDERTQNSHLLPQKLRVL